MAKIFIYIFSLLSISSLLAESISKKELIHLRQNAIYLYNDKKYTDSIPLFEKYLSFRSEPKIKLYLAKSILQRKDFPEPEEADEIFIRQNKIYNIIENYKKASKIFAEVVPYLEQVTPKDRSIPDLYFLWAFSEYFAKNKEKAIGLFKKSAMLKPELKNIANYNVAVIYEELGQNTDSQIYFNK